MTLLLGLYAVLVVTSSLFIGYVMLRHVVGAWFYKNFSDPDPYPPEAAEAPKSLDEHFTTAPREDLDIDWHRYEYEMKRKQT